MQCLGIVSAVDGRVGMVPAILQTSNDIFPELVVQRSREAEAIGLLRSALGGKELVPILKNFSPQVERKFVIQATPEICAENGIIISCTAENARIINIAAVVGLVGNAGQANYAASKAGLIGFTKSVAKELAKSGVTVNAIAPGFIATDMTDELSDKVKDAIKANIPMGELGAVDDIAGAALYLASPAARYVTGQVLTVDGGMVM